MPLCYHSWNNTNIRCATYFKRPPFVVLWCGWDDRITIFNTLPTHLLLPLSLPLYLPTSFPPSPIRPTYLSVPPSSHPNIHLYTYLFNYSSSHLYLQNQKPPVLPERNAAHVVRSDVFLHLNLLDVQQHTTFVFVVIKAQVRSNCCPARRGTIVLDRSSGTWRPKI